MVIFLASLVTLEAKILLMEPQPVSERGEPDFPPKNESTGTREGILD